MENVENVSTLSYTEQAKEELPGEMTEPATATQSSLIDQDVAETNKTISQSEDTAIKSDEETFSFKYTLGSAPQRVSESDTTETGSEMYVTPRSTLRGQSESSGTPRILLDESGIEKEEMEFGEFDNRSVLRTSSSFDFIGDEDVQDISAEDIENMNNLANADEKPTSEISADSRQIMEDLFTYKQQQQVAGSVDDMCKWSTASTCSNDTIAQQRMFLNESAVAEVVDDRSERVGELLDNGVEVNDNEVSPTVELVNCNPVEASNIPAGLSTSAAAKPESAGVSETATKPDVIGEPEVSERSDSAQEAEASGQQDLSKESEIAEDVIKEPEFDVTKTSVDETTPEIAEVKVSVIAEEIKEEESVVLPEEKQADVELPLTTEDVEKKEDAANDEWINVPMSGAEDPELEEVIKEPELGVLSSVDDNTPDISSKPENLSTPAISEAPVIAEAIEQNDSSLSTVLAPDETQADVEKPVTTGETEEKKADVKNPATTEETEETKADVENPVTTGETEETKADVNPATTGETEETKADVNPVTTGETEETKDSANDGWIDVLGSGALKKRTKKAGSGQNLEKGQQVRIKYTLMLSSGKIVDDELEQTFQLGDGEVIDAIDLTANLAQVGEVYETMSQSRFAYGILGRPPQIGPNSSILMIVEIIQAEDTPKILDLPEVERIKIGDRKRTIGNEHYSRHDFARASINYQSACKYLDPPSYEVAGVVSAEVKDLQAKTWCNLALSELKNEKFDAGILAADRALQIDPKSTKALYRKGKLLQEKGDLDKAEEVLKQALKIDPSSVGCKQFLKELSQKVSSQKKKQQRMYKKMLNLEDEEKEEKVTSFGENQTSWIEGAIPTIAGGITVGALAMAAYYGIKSLQG